MIQRPPRPTLCPYTTLFRSLRVRSAHLAGHEVRDRRERVREDEARGHRRVEERIALPRDRRGPVVAPRDGEVQIAADRKSTRLNSSHGYTSYAVFCLKKKST